MKQNTLTDALKQSASKRQSQPATPKTRTRAKKDDSATKTNTPPSRVGKSFVGGWFAPEIARTINILALKQSTSQQRLVEEGLRAVFKKYGEIWPE